MNINLQLHPQRFLVAKAVFHGIFDHGLKDQLGNPACKRLGLHVNFIGKTPVKPVFQNGQVILQVIQILPQGHLLAAPVQAVAQQAGKAEYHFGRDLRLDAAHITDIFQRVIQEMGIKLALQLFDLGGRHQLRHLPVIFHLQL